MRDLGRSGDGFRLCYVTLASGGFQPFILWFQVVTDSPAPFLLVRPPGVGGTLAALVSLNSIILEQYIIASRVGRKARIPAAFTGDAILGNASRLLHHASLVCVVTANHNRSDAR